MTDYEKFFEISFDAMCVATATHFVEVNPTMCTLLGRSQEELLNTPIVEFVVPADRAAVDRLFRNPESSRFITEGLDSQWLIHTG